MFSFLSFDNSEGLLMLIEGQGHYLVGIMYEVEYDLSVEGQKGCYFSMFVVAAGVLFDYSLVEEVVDENIALLVGHENVFAQDL